MEVLNEIDLVYLAIFLGRPLPLFWGVFSTLPRTAFLVGFLGVLGASAFFTPFLVAIFRRLFGNFYTRSENKPLHFSVTAACPDSGLRTEISLENDLEL